MAEIREALPEGLLADVKNSLDITWQDTATDNKLKNIIASGIQYLKDKIGVVSSADFVHDGFPRTLLFEFVRYSRDNALDVFENNYRSFLIGAQNNERLMEYVAETE